MQAPNLSYYAFVSKFVHAITTDALSTELHRLRSERVSAAKVRQLQTQQPAAPNREAA